MTRRASPSAERSDPEPGEPGFLSALHDVLDDVRDVARARAALLAQAAEREADRLEARLRRVALLSGACLAAGVLLISGIAAGLGELAGRYWLGQVATGVGVLAGVIAWSAVARARQRRKPSDQAAEAEKAALRGLADTGRSLPLLALAGAAGWAAGLFLGQRQRHGGR